MYVFWSRYHYIITWVLLGFCFFLERLLLVSGKNFPLKMFDNSSVESAVIGISELISQLCPFWISLMLSFILISYCETFSMPCYYLGVAYDYDLSYSDSWICKVGLHGFICSLQAADESGPRCESCGLSLPSKRAKKLKHESKQLFCRHCTKVCMGLPYYMAFWVIFFLFVI